MMDNTLHLPTADYERNILTLDLPNAAQPVLWRREISDINQLSFTLAQDNHLHALIYQSAGETDWHTIASFNDRDSANAALQAVRGALFQPRRRQKSAHLTGGQINPRWVRGPLKWALLTINGLLVLIGLFVILQALIIMLHRGAAPKTAQSAAAPAPVAQTAPVNTPATTDVPDGRAVPADQVLSPPLNLPAQ